MNCSQRGHEPSSDPGSVPGRLRGLHRHWSGNHRPPTGERASLLCCSPHWITDRLLEHGRICAPGHPTSKRSPPGTSPYPNTRAVVVVDVERISDSCGFGVPVMEVTQERGPAQLYAHKEGLKGMASYRAEKNRYSIDGLLGLWSSSAVGRMVSDRTAKQHDDE